MRTTLLALAAPVLAACTQPVTERERAMFLEAADLAEWGYQGEVRPQDEKVASVRSVDGTRELTYAYESSDPRQPLYVNVSVTLQGNIVAARLQGIAQDVGVGIGLRNGGVTERPMAGGQVWGDASELQALMLGDDVVGHRFSARAGGRTYHLVMSGLHTDDAETWDEMIGPQMRAFLDYAPR
ncbi:MAG: hypothetical protein K0Q76_3919 [Panacagrimonas sp.]|jgi:hypothetical protein|nr:hypothetical protein [Panacagrimonas sp.]MCC2658811.1 hypothetical protein [Panacagrimonas sp.]